MGERDRKGSKVNRRRRLRRLVVRERFIHAKGDQTLFEKSRARRGFGKLLANRLPSKSGVVEQTRAREIVKQCHHVFVVPPSPDERLAQFAPRHRAV